VLEQFESERLIIRVPQAGDGKALNEAILESFKELCLWMPWAKEKPSLEESEAHCISSREKFLAREDIQLLLFLKSTAQLIGSSGLHRINWAIPKFEIGYWCRTSAVGKGYISEAVHQIACFAFEQLGANRVEIRTDEKNVRSWRVAERSGFTYEGLLRNECRDAHGKLRDTRIYSAIKPPHLRTH